MMTTMMTNRSKKVKKSNQPKKKKDRKTEKMAKKKKQQNKLLVVKEQVCEMANSLAAKEVQEPEDAKYCQICFDLFPTMQALHCHIRLDHFDFDSMMCPFCPQVFARKVSLDFHISAFHKHNQNESQLESKILAQSKKFRRGRCQKGGSGNPPECKKTTFQKKNFESPVNNVVKIKLLKKTRPIVTDQNTSGVAITDSAEADNLHVTLKGFNCHLCKFKSTLSCLVIQHVVDIHHRNFANHQI